MKTKEELQAIFDSLDDNAQFGLSFGLFPSHLMEKKLDNHEAAELIRISQAKTKIEM